MSKIPGPDRVLYRFLAGQPLDGHYRTDATFFRRGLKSLAKVAPRRWSYLPGWQRSAVRVTTVFALLACTWGWAYHRRTTVATLAAVALLAALYGAVRLWQAFRRRQLHRDYVRPLHAVLSPLLGLPADTRPGDYITVPQTFRTDEATPAVIRLPRSFNPSGANREAVSVTALAKLRLNSDNTDVIFHLVGDPTVELKMAPQPPNTVLWEDSKEIMETLPPGQIFVGRQARNAPYIRDFNAGEVVHGGFSCQTGTGKSAAAMAWIAQALHSDPETTATFVDPKQSAQPACLVGVPGYTLANDPDNVGEMWRVIEVFETEIIRRRRLRNDDPTLEFPLMYLYLDELSEFMDMSREYWQDVRLNPEAFGYDGPIPKNQPMPIVRSIARILRMSREFGGRVLVFTQRLDNASTGGIGLRDLFGWRGLAGFRKNQWMMLVGTTPIPKSVKRVGRWIYSDGDREVWVQNVYGTPEQLRDWAIAGRRPVDTRVGHTATDDVSPGGLQDSAQWDIVGLKAAAAYLDIPVSTFRKRRQRAIQRGEGIPGEGLQGRSPCWTTAQLDNFASKVGDDEQTAKDHSSSGGSDERNDSSDARQGHSATAGADSR